MTFRSALMAALALSLAALPAAARQGDVLPPKDKSILTWSPAEQAAGYRRIEDVAPVHVIKRGKRVHPLPHAKGPEPTIAFSAGGKDYTTDSLMKALNISGLLVLKDGKIVLERYGLGRTEQDRWISFSVAKSVTSTLAGAAVKDGAIKSLDDPVTRYIPELAGGAYDGVSVKNLLTMSSGVKWSEDYADQNSDVARYTLDPIVAGKHPVVSYMSRLPREAAPGAKFLYKTGETDLAGILVERATGKTLADYASEKIWKPYGMERDGVWMLDPAGHERGGCCISMTLRDYARVGQFMLDGGAGALPDGWIEQATHKRVETVAPGRAGGGYGYFWWIDGPSDYSARGIFGQMIYISPAQRTVIVVNSAAARATSAEATVISRAFVAATLAAVR
ncbi:MAG: beta-lactamase [Acidimicrobiales bacterium]|nr:beta-lactamase [Acidimicrobiales bacterium]